MAAASDIVLESFDLIACSRCGAQCDVQGREAFSLFACPACGNEMRVPARFANFIVLEQLGKGGMGAVYRAYDETLGRTVALKVMQQSIGKDRAFVTQFLQEARALAAINHPDIVQIYSYGEENGQPYIVMELVDGDRLDHIHEKRKSLDELFVLQTAIEVAAGMQAAEAAGMTHGDIKPANILYDKAGRAKVADFGLARLKGEKPRPGEVWGTPYYVSPEAVRGQAPDASSDIYSLGGTLYHVLTGEPPFNGKTVTDTVLARFKAPPRDPRELKPGVSEATAKILMRMLEADAMARYPNYASLLRDLEQAREKLKEARSGKKPPSKGKSVAVVMAGVVALAAVVVGGVLVFQAIQRHNQKADEAAQFEREKAEGKWKQVMRGGKLTWVKTEVLEGVRAAEAAVAVTPSGGGAVSGGAAAGGTGEVAASKDWSAGAGGKTAEGESLVLRGPGEGGEESQIRLEFPVGAGDSARFKGAKLRLVCRATAKKKTQACTVTAWGLKADGKPGGKLGEGALASNPETGDTFEMELPRLEAFWAKEGGDTLAVALTASSDGEQKKGWVFTASEDAGRFRPPTLVLGN